MTAPAGPWARLASALTLVWVVWYALDLVVLATRLGLYNEVHRGLDGLWPRVAFAVLAWGVAFHSLEGLRRAVVGLVPAVAARDAVLRDVACFVTMAVWIPVGLAIVWPAVTAWWVR
jgi:succinate dehydrogenase/fumarate reductase cytochrome b subunit